MKAKEKEATKDMPNTETQEPFEVSSTALREYLDLSIEQYLTFSPFSESVLDYLETTYGAKALSALSPFMKVNVLEVQGKFLEPTLEVHQKALDGYSFSATLDPYTSSCVGAFSLMMRDWKEREAPVLNLAFVYPLMRLIGGDISPEDFSDTYLERRAHTSWQAVSTRDLFSSLKALDTWLTMLTVFRETFNPQEVLLEATEEIFPAMRLVEVGGKGLSKEHLEGLVKDLSIEGDTFVSRVLREVSSLKSLSGENAGLRIEKYLNYIDKQQIVHNIGNLYYLKSSTEEGRAFPAFISTIKELTELGSHIYSGYIVNGVKELNYHQKVFLMSTRDLIDSNLRALQEGA